MTNSKEKSRKSDFEIPAFHLSWSGKTAKMEDISELERFT